MTRDDIIALAQEAVFDYPNENPFDFRLCRIETVERFAALVAAEKEQQMIRAGYRQCAKGQRTTQFCGLLDAAVKAEREECAKVAESYEPRCDVCPSGVSNAIRARGET